MGSAQSESLQPPPEDVADNPVAPMPEAAPVPTDPTVTEENIPVDAPLEPPPTNPSPAEPPPVEPVPSAAAPTPAPPAVDAGDDCAASDGFTISGSSSCYLVGETTSSWQTARDFCQAWGGDLVEIGSAEENAQLAERIDVAAWIGATDEAVEGTFRWPSGNALEYEAWAVGQPNNLQGLEDCVELRAAGDQWGDAPCVDNIPRQALCERP